MEIEFAPMDFAMGGGGGDPLMAMLGAAGGSPMPSKPTLRGPARGGREAELDDLLAGVINSMLVPGGPTSRAGGAVGGRPEVTDELVLGPWLGGNGGSTVIEMDGPAGRPSGRMQTGRSSLPASLLRDMFPGSMMSSSSPTIIDGPFGGPFGDADPVMMDVMQDMDRRFAQEMLPAIHAASPDRDPRACQEDVKKNCAGAKSHLHCLGLNHENISEGCRKAVGQSVPFRCSKAISRFCDVLQTGILSCLYEHMPDLEPTCRDAVLTTKHVINKVNTQKATLVDPSSGAKKASTPGSDKGTASTQKEASLDVKLGAKQHAPAAPPATKQNTREASLDAKLGLKQTVEVPKKDQAALETAATPQAPEFVIPPANGWQTECDRLSVFLIVAILAFGAYVFAFSDYTNKVQKYFARRHRLEGTKLLGGAELLKLDSI